MHMHTVPSTYHACTVHVVSMHSTGTRKNKKKYKYKLLKYM